MPNKIYETKYFGLFIPLMPHVSREDGSHLVIDPLRRVNNRTELTPYEAIDCMRLTMIVGEALGTVLNKNGIDIGRINYQDNGNWFVDKPEGPHFHIHVYGRARNSKTQKWGEALNFPHPRTGAYENIEPLHDEDIKKIIEEIEKISLEEKYQYTNWGL